MTVLPASVYLRGMLMSIARELGLDPAPGVEELHGARRVR